MLGRVLDAAGAPISSARITALPGDGRWPGSDVLSNPDGDFTVPLNPGFYTFHIVAGGFTDIWETVVVRSTDSKPREFRLSAAPHRQTHGSSNSAAITAKL